MNPRLVLMVAAVAALALLAAGCGGSDSSGGDPATLAPEQTPFYVEAAVQPQGELKTNVEALAKSIAGVDDLGGLIVSELESSSDSSDEEIDFAKEVEPWLGEKGGVALEEYDGDDFTGYAIAVQTTDADAAQAFVDKTEKADGATEGSYEGDRLLVDAEDASIVGIVGDFLAGAENEQIFKADGRRLERRIAGRPGRLHRTPSTPRRAEASRTSTSTSAA